MVRLSKVNWLFMMINYPYTRYFFFEENQSNPIEPAMTAVIISFPGSDQFLTILYKKDIRAIIGRLD